jgi:murein DD-endopeptidase MepM/ murein hydrolase activator NlpD
MQKNDKFYTFLFAHKYNKSKIYIKRVALPKSYIHFGSLSIFLVIGLVAAAIGIGRTVNTTAFAENVAKASALTQLSAQPLAENVQDFEQQPQIDYSFNSGGPEENADENGEDSEVDKAIDAIRNNADPAFLPTMWAHLGKINNEFGFRRNPFGGRSYEFHPGMDIDGERGDLVLAPANGTVVSAGYKGGYGNMVQIDHGNGLTTCYGHMSKLEAAAGDNITRGQLIGYVGSTGRSTGPHLHYELRLSDRPINPRHFLPPEPTDLTSLRK